MESLTIQDVKKFLATHFENEALYRAELDKIGTELTLLNRRKQEIEEQLRQIDSLRQAISPPPLPPLPRPLSDYVNHTVSSSSYKACLVVDGILMPNDEQTAFTCFISEVTLRIYNKDTRCIVVNQNWEIDLFKKKTSRQGLSKQQRDFWNAYTLKHDITPFEFYAHRPNAYSIEEVCIVLKDLLQRYHINIIVTLSGDLALELLSTEPRLNGIYKKIRVDGTILKVVEK